MLDKVTLEDNVMSLERFCDGDISDTFYKTLIWLSLTCKSYLSTPPPLPYPVSATDYHVRVCAVQVLCQNSESKLPCRMLLGQRREQLSMFIYIYILTSLCV